MSSESLKYESPPGKPCGMRHGSPAISENTERRGGGRSQEQREEGRAGGLRRPEQAQSQVVGTGGPAGCPRGGVSEPAGKAGLPHRPLARPRQNESEYPQKANDHKSARHLRYKGILKLSERRKRLIAEKGNGLAGAPLSAMAYTVWVAPQASAHTRR